MRVIIDSNSLQARVHAQDDKRLTTFLDLARTIPASEVAFSPAGPLTDAILSGQDVLVITTRKGERPRHWRDFLRMPAIFLRRWPAKSKPNSGDDFSAPSLPACPYSAAELDSIADFVRRGGGLLLLSNHGDAPRLSPYDMTQNDALLARRFGVEIENTFFANPDPAVVTEFSGADLLAMHPIIHGAAGEAPVHSVVTHNCSSIVAPSGDPLIRLNSRMRDHRNGFAPEGRCFAIAVEDTSEVANGRVVAAADSGFIGAAGTTFPGVGLIDRGDNWRFVYNALRWLGRAL